MIDESDEYAGMAQSLIDFAEGGLKNNNAEQQKNKAAYEKFIESLGEPNRHSVNAWLPDQQEQGEAVGALEGDKPGYINPEDLDLNSNLKDPRSPSKKQLLVTSKSTDSKNGIKISPQEVRSYICLEGLTYQMLGKGEEPRKIITSYLLGPDGRTRVLKMWRDERASIPKIEYMELNEKVPENFWPNALKLLNGQWREDPVLREKVEVRRAKSLQGFVSQKIGAAKQAVRNLVRR